MKRYKSYSMNSVQSELNALPTLKLKTLAFACMLGFSSLNVFAQSPGTNAPAVKPTSDKADLNFVNADIESVVKAIGHFTGTTFILDPRVKGQINLVSETPLTKDQAFKLLTSNLRLLGYAVVTSDGYSKVVPESDAKLHAGPANITGAESRGDGQAKKGDQIVTEVYKLNFENASNIQNVIRPLISPNNTITVNPGNNSVVITDYADNIKRLNKIIAALDIPANSDMDIVQVKYSIASDIATMLNKVIDNGGQGDANRVVLLADPRSNTLLLKAPTAARANQIKSLITKLDQPTSTPGNIHVVYLKNAEAVKLAQTLRAIYTGDQSGLNSQASNSSSTLTGIGNSQGNTAQVGAGSAQGSAGITSLGQGISAVGSTNQNNSQSNLSASSGAGFIQADASTNTLIITASEAVYRNLRGVIDQLDARRAQVYIESLIVEVSAERAHDFGVQWLGLTGDETSNYRVGGATSFAKDGNNLINLAGSALTGKTGAVLPGNGISLGLFKQTNGKLGLGALARALETDGGTNVLSIPTLVTLDNEEAAIHVGKNVPIITGQYTTANGGSAAANPFQTIDRKPVGLKLVVKPQISEGGIVKMAIYQEVSSIDDVTNTAGIITRERAIKTNVLVDDGQIIVLGGLMQDDNSDGVDKVPGLGDLPIIGNLFKYKSSKRSKTNLLVFLRPLVIKNADQTDKISLDRYDYLRTQLAPFATNPNDPVLPQLEKGKPMQIPRADPMTNNTGK